MQQQLSAYLSEKASHQTDLTMFVSIYIISFAATLMHTTSAFNTIEHAPVVASAEIILNDMNHAISTTRSIFMSRTSPQCWMKSISQWPSASGATFCASMTEEQQKLLALELTNCQLMEESRPLFRQEDDSLQVSQNASCHVGKGGSEPFEVSSCLPLMSDFALNLYHQMFLYTNELCNRLTYDMMEQQKEESTLMLIRASSSFVDLTRQQQLDADNAQKELLETIVQSNLHIQEQQQQWEKANHQLQMEAVRAQEARERAADAHTREVEAGKNAALLAMQEMIDNNRMQLQEQQQTWQELNSAREKEMSDIDERRKQAEAIIEKQQQDMERMQKILADTNSQMQPLSSIYLYVKMFLSGFTALKSMLIAFMSVKVLSWIISARRSLYKVLFVGSVAELVALCLDLANAADTQDKDKSLANGEINAVEGTQNYIRFAAYIVCALIFLIRRIYLQQDTTSGIAIDEELKRQREFEARLRAVHQIDSNTVRAPIQIMQSPPTDHGMKVQRQNTYNREEALEEAYVIKSDLNFKPSERGYSSNYRPCPIPKRECYSPQLASKRSYTVPVPIDGSKTANVVTVTPNTRIYDQQHDSASTQRKDVNHLQQMQRNQECSSDSSVEMDDSIISDEDEPTQSVMTKKKRKYSELKSSDTELGYLPLKQKAKEGDLKKKRSKLEAIKIY